MPIGPVFLSAGVPDPHRDEKYFKTGDTGAIRDAVIALLEVVLPGTKLVFGGNPAITPIVKWVADQLGAFDNVRIFQSKFFQDKYLKDLDRFRYVETEAVDGDRDQSLFAMRTQMIGSEDFSAAFFIGGMDGVEREYEMFRDARPHVPRFPVYTTGAAARLIWARENDPPASQRQVGDHDLQALRTKAGYLALFRNLLDGAALR